MGGCFSCFTVPDEEATPLAPARQRTTNTRVRKHKTKNKAPARRAFDPQRDVLPPIPFHGRRLCAGRSFSGLNKGSKSRLAFTQEKQLLTSRAVPGKPRLWLRALHSLLQEDASPLVKTNLS